MLDSLLQSFVLNDCLKLIESFEILHIRKIFRIPQILKIQIL